MQPANTSGYTNRPGLDRSKASRTRRSYLSRAWRSTSSRSPRSPRRGLRLQAGRRRPAADRPLAAGRSGDPRLLVGSATADDAAVFQLRDDLALVQTLDFFTPVVDDPYDFGRIAAANALSDVYAMGGDPLTALNVVAFPLERLGGDVLREILRGGADVVRAAGAQIVGGHSIDDPEPKYGLAVTGTVDPRELITNAGGRPGDALTLTKPLGVGAVVTARKRGAADDALLAGAPSR